MAITWGAQRSSSDNWFRLGYEFIQSPSSVGSGTSSVTVTLKLYVETQRSVVDSTNSWDISGNFSGSGSVSINNGSGGGVDLITTKSRTVSTSYNGTVTSSFSASLDGINAIPGTASVSGSFTTAKRPHVAPSAPSSMTTKLSGTTLTTTWRNNPSTAGPYDNIRVRRSVNGGSFADVSTPSGSSTSYSQGIPSKNSTVRYAIRAENEAGDSAWVYGPTVTVPPDPPYAPDNIAASRTSDTSHTISWVKDPGTTSSNPYTNIEVQRWDNVSDVWSTIATLSGSATSYTNTSTVANRQYRWRVRAKNSGGASGYVYTGYWSTTPAAPGTPKASKFSNDITLTWANAATAGTAVEVWHAANGVWDGSALAVLAGQPTTYTHINPNAAQTHQYRLKAQAGGADDAPTTYSGNSGYSNIVQLLTNPAAPTQLSPASGTVDAAAAPVVLSWQHNEVDGTAQTKYDLQYRLNGGAWTTVSATSATQSRTFAAGSLPNGSIMDWQVRTYGQYATAPAYSPWSAAATLTLSATPQAGLIFPDDVTPVDTSRITAEWSYYDEEGTDQAQWKVTLYSAGGERVLETRTGVGPETSVPLTTLLADATSYRIGVQVQDGSSLWSPETVQDFTVAYALPDTPGMDLLWDPERAAVVVTVVNPAGTGAEVAYNEIWRSTDWLTYELVATDVPVNGSVTDYIPVIGSENVYQVVAVTPIEASAASAPVVYITPDAEGWFIVNAGEDFSRNVRVRYSPTLNRDFSRDKALNKYAGRDFPVETVGEHRNRVFDLSVKIFGDDDANLAALEAVADLPGPLVLRTPLRDRLYVSLEGLPSSRAIMRETVSMKLTQVDAPDRGTMALNPVVYQTNWAKDPSFTGSAAPFLAGGITYTFDSGEAKSGSTFMHLTDTVGGSNRFAGQSVIIPPGFTFVRATVAVRNLAGSGFIRARIGYRDLPTTGTITYGTLTTGIQAPEWTTVTVEAVVPGTTQYLNVLVYATNGTTSTVADLGTEWGVDSLCVELGTTAEDTGPATYFDGDVWEGDEVLKPRWTGTPHASTSELTRGGTP